jgi:hypothetical protein
MTPFTVSVIILLSSPIFGLLSLLSSSFSRSAHPARALKWLAIAALTLGLAGTLSFGVFVMGFV